VTDPNGDDNGPGNYAYPTSADFHAGAFDMQRFQVIDGGSNGLITFRVQVRDLSPTFGSPLGAQLVDVYVRDPSASAANTSTAASFPQRNYVIDPAAAWNQLIEVQGFGQRYVDAHGTTLGTVSIRANSSPRHYATNGPVTARWNSPASPETLMPANACASSNASSQKSSRSGLTLCERSKAEQCAVLDPLAWHGFDLAPSKTRD